MIKASLQDTLRPGPLTALVYRLTLLEGAGALARKG